MLVSCGEKVGVALQSFGSDSGQSESSGLNIWVVYVCSDLVPTDLVVMVMVLTTSPNFDCVAVGPPPRTI